MSIVFILSSCCALHYCEETLKRNTFLVSVCTAQVVDYMNIRDQLDWKYRVSREFLCESFSASNNLFLILVLQGVFHNADVWPLILAELHAISWRYCLIVQQEVVGDTENTVQRCYIRKCAFEHSDWWRHHLQIFHNTRIEKCFQETEAKMEERVECKNSAGI